MTDEQLFALARARLFTAVVGDVMDQLGARRQFLPPTIRPLDHRMVLIGRAMTVLGEDRLPTRGRRSKAGAPLEDFGLMFKALDDLRWGEVYLCTGASPAYALWGELMSTRARKCGASGAVCHGYVRDTRGILRLGFPTFAFGSYAQDQRGRGQVIDFRIPIVVGNVRVHPGDIVFGDLDGVCVVPRALEREVFTRALEKAATENHVRRALRRGVTAQAAFEKWAVL